LCNFERGKRGGRVGEEELTQGDDVIYEDLIAVAKEVEAVWKC
jgi:hypothetical protein